LSRFQRPPPRRRPSVVAIGNFDGVHLGHRAVLRELFAAAARHRARACVLTFDPAPTAVVAPERHQPRIQTTRARLAELRAAGVHVVVVEPFTPAFAAQSAEQFVNDVLLDRLDAYALVVGHDFRFGNMRAGDAASIRAIAPSIELVEVPALRDESGPISSSRIRRAVAAGDIQQAARLLGRPFSLSGIIVHGDQRARTLGFPTANLVAEEELRPAYGVYAGHVDLRWGPPAKAVINVGVRPTVDGEKYMVEAHIFGFAGNLYGRPARVLLEHRLREERKFPSLDALAAQIREDAAQAVAALG